MENETSAAVKLSIEIIEIIIDYLQGHPYSLQSCCRVSRSWLPRSRFHLFRRIHLYYQHECGNLYAIVQQSPHIASLIQELHIRDGQDGEGYHSWIKTTPSLLSFLDYLTHLAVLSFRCHKERFTPELEMALQQVVIFNPIVSLAFSECLFPIQWIRTIVQSCDRLKCLELQRCGVEGEEDLKAVVGEMWGVLPHTIQLDDLRIDSECRKALFPMNPITGPESGFDLLHLHTLHCDDSHFFQTLLDSLGGSLHHLVLTSPKGSWPGHPPVVKYVNSLESNTGLQSLQVTRLATPDYDAILWLASLLRSSASALHLKEIIMDFYMFDMWTETVYWHPIDEVFEDSAFPGLTKVDIDFATARFRGPTRPVPSQKEISANGPNQFPRLYRREILQLKLTLLPRAP